MSAEDIGTRRADVVILIAIRLELDAVLQVDAGAVPGSTWEQVSGPSGLPVAFRSFLVENGRPLRVAVAVSPDMGQYEPGLAAMREAVDLYRTLATRHPEAFQPDLAMSLHNLGLPLSELG